ncbi:MAG: hypothetical protein ACM3XO_26875, partial [Bacteroidota bacterium]
DPYQRELLITSVLEAEPEAIARLPKETTIPFWAALSLFAFFTGVLVSFWWLALLGTLCTTALLMAWFWPEKLSPLDEGAKP